MPAWCTLCISCSYDILPGGEGESEEDEEDETVTELKKPNSDEVRASRSGTGTWVSDWLMG